MEGKQMTHDFRYDYVTDWKAGGHSKIDTPFNRIVLYDQTYTAYMIDPKNHNAFVDWIAQIWEKDYEPRDIINSEPAQDYLDRIGVTILEPERA